MDNKLIDIHTHVLPFVDDGAKSYNESIEMLKMMINQNISDVILTPHVQSVASKVERIDHFKHFNELKKIVKDNNLNINIYLGSELRHRSHLHPNLDELVIENSKYILIEFSTTNEEEVCDVVYNISKKGYIPIVAHAERYEYLSLDEYYKIKQNGGLIQVNSNAVIGMEGRMRRKLIKKLLDLNLVDFIASDAHSVDKRKPNLVEAFNYLKKSLDLEYLNKLFYENAKKILI